MLVPCSKSRKSSRSPRVAASFFGGEDRSQVKKTNEKAGTANAENIIGFLKGFLVRFRLVSLCLPGLPCAFDFASFYSAALPTAQFKMGGIWDAIDVDASFKGRRFSDCSSLGEMFLFGLPNF